LEDWKIKISVLWLFGEVAWLTAVLLVLYEPGGIEQVMAGEIYGMQIGPEWLLIVAITLLVPLVMAFLSLTLEGSMNRWANIIVGIVFTVLNLQQFGRGRERGRCWWDTIDGNFSSCGSSIDRLVCMEVKKDNQD